MLAGLLGIRLSVAGALSLTLLSVGAVCSCYDSDAEVRLRAEAWGHRCQGSQPGDVSAALGKKEV